MVDTLPNVTLPANTWVDLYVATGITIGVKIQIQNLGSNTVRLATVETEPTPSTGYSEIHFRTNIGMENQVGDSGAWAYSESQTGLLNIRVA